MDTHLQREVAQGLREGKAEAWRALYDAYCRPVWHSVARAMGPDSADVGDVVQETFLAAARSARHFDPDRGSLWMWLSGIARRQVALHYRQQKRHDRAKDHRGLIAGGARQVLRWLDNGQQTPEEALASVELSSAVRATLTELSTDYETLLTAKYLDGISVEEIASASDSSSTAVRSKLARARKAFRRAFANTSACSDNGHGRQTS
ncbi:MAG TPA: sigma-70 family RNA polymerase sigma factor [Thermoguttaceae bacterium]|nr:sigma-70 family RNA polymerase sigma factor [Thermoguttaceae bacterium]